jgi:Na+-dependent transporters of the SNF family
MRYPYGRIFLLVDLLALVGLSGMVFSMMRRQRGRAPDSLRSIRPRRPAGDDKAGICGTKKGRSKSSGLHSVGRIVPTLGPQRSPIRGRICEHGTENTSAGNFRCSGGDTQKKITQVMLRCSEKCTKLASSAATKVRREGRAENARGACWSAAAPPAPLVQWQTLN